VRQNRLDIQCRRALSFLWRLVRWPLALRAMGMVSGLSAVSVVWTAFVLFGHGGVCLFLIRNDVVSLLSYREYHITNGCITTADEARMEDWQIGM
jgi:hypothetical protein